MTADPGSLRLGWADLLRATAVLVVVIFHAGVTVVEPTTVGAGLVGFLRPVVMPLLLVLSGLFAAARLRGPLRPYAERQLRCIAWPWALWTVVMAVLWPGHLVADPVGFLTLGTHTWFLAVLLVAGGLAFLSRRAPPTLGAAMLVLTATVLQQEHAVVAFYLFHASFFFVGLALANRLTQWLEAGVAWFTLAAGFGLYGGLRQMGNGASQTAEVGALEIILSVSAVLATIWLGYRVPRSTAVRALEWLGRNALVVYLVHFPVLILTLQIIDPMQLPVLATAGIGLVASFSVGVLFAFGRRRSHALFVAPAIRPVRQGGAGGEGLARGQETDRTVTDTQTS